MPDEHDPYGIVPDSFISDYNADTFEEALRRAENAPSTTPDDTRERCPECGSIRIRFKTGRSQEHKINEHDYKCTGCCSHFSKPAKPLVRLESYSRTEELLEEGHEHAARLARAANDATPDQLQHGFVWVDPDGLEAEPDPGFSDELPDFSHGNRREAIRRAIRLSKPWSKDHGLSLRETAKYIPFSRGWIDSRRQEWRNGQHRHIVPSPEPATAAGGQLATDGGTE